VIVCEVVAGPWSLHFLLSLIHSSFLSRRVLLHLVDCTEPLGPMAAGTRAVPIFNVRSRADERGDFSGGLPSSFPSLTNQRTFVWGHRQCLSGVPGMKRGIVILHLNYKRSVMVSQICPKTHLYKERDRHNKRESAKFLHFFKQSKWAKQSQNKQMTCPIYVASRSIKV
jgi:hypothetical protein